MSSLKGKHIILGVTGGIAAYKSVTLLRLLTKAGAEVQVVMTPAAKEFVAPVTFASLSQKPVVSEFFTANTGEWHSHVDLGLWADAMVVAPATASTIGKMANGIADNMLVTTYLSAKEPVWIAPAMDLDMMRHPSTVANIERLRSFGNHIIEPGSGALASGLSGKGRMAEPEEIVATLESHFATAGSMTGKTVTITAGPTREKLDPVRFISNFSSGKMGYALAEEAARRGARVILVSGPVALEARNPLIEVRRVESAEEMLAEARKAFAGSDIAIMCAAVADYRPAAVSPSKLKRGDSPAMTLELVRNPDIAATLGSEKRPEQTLVGFALETDDAIAHGADKLRRKNLDMIVVNSLADKGAGFGTDTNLVTIITADGRRTAGTLKPKSAVAADIIDSIETLRNA
ncbi:MAG: bifunctional phosphopantothenoylcysteine decarboxylase/phosphopantothenate--cysteine ligase CoaBC [Muribaculaceae bacterium]|nr:bifunctional phosphopantothenoylcysteine decarboxylase/phosphopantothenate--cysteine ligase CoaBC [Prevotella sp.]